MPTTVSVSPDDLPDVTCTRHDDGSYEVAITGLAGLADRPRAPTRTELAEGILSANPPTVRTTDRERLELLMLRAVEMAMPDGLLDNLEGVAGVADKESILLAQLTRTIRRGMIALEPPE